MFAEAPCNLRGLPIPVTFRITSARLKPPACTSRRLRMLSPPLRFTRLIPPVSYMCAMLGSVSSLRVRWSSLPPFAAGPSPVGVHLLLFLCLTFPVARPPVGFPNISAALRVVPFDQYGSAVVSLVGYHLLDPAQVHLRLLFRRRRNFVQDQLGHRISRFRK